MEAKSNKVAIWIAVIGALGIIIVAFINGCFSSSAGSSGNTQAVKASPKVDSGSIQIAPVQIQQGDSSKAEVKIENIARDKIVNNNYPPPQPKEKEKAKERKLNAEDIGRLKTIPEGYKVSIMSPLYDREAYEYATEIRNKLESFGFKVNFNQAGTIYPSAPNPRFSLTPDDIKKEASITVIPLPKKD